MEHDGKIGLDTINKTDISNIWNRTALMEAAAGGYLNIVQYLLDKGANPSLKDREGKTALDLAQEKNYTKIVTLLSNVR